jgi:hypothetical protein
MSTINEIIIKSPKELFMEDMFNEFKRDGNYYLNDIEFIDGISVNVLIVRSHMKDLIIRIESDEVYINANPFGLYDSFIKIEGTKELLDFQEAFEKVIIELQEISFDKITSRFVKKNKNYVTQIFPELFKSGKVVSNQHECCVCYEKTRQRTPCNHILCFPCWSKVKSVKNKDDEKEKPCPLCREDLCYDETLDEDN